MATCAMLLSCQRYASSTESSPRTRSGSTQSRIMRMPERFSTSITFQNRLGLFAGCCHDGNSTILIAFPSARFYKSSADVCISVSQQLQNLPWHVRLKLRSPPPLRIPMDPTCQSALCSQPLVLFLVARSCLYHGESGTDNSNPFWGGKARIDTHLAARAGVTI